MRFTFERRIKEFTVVCVDPENPENVEESKIKLRQALKSEIENVVASSQTSISVLQQLMREEFIKAGVMEDPNLKDSEEESPEKTTPNLTVRQRMDKKAEIESDFGLAMADLVVQGQVDFLLLFIEEWDFEGPDGNPLPIDAESLIQIRNYNTNIYTQIQLCCEEMQKGKQKEAEQIEKN